MIARWMEAYSLADEKAASARVRLIMSGLLVACAMSWERLSSESISPLYASTVSESDADVYAPLRMSLILLTWVAIWLTLERMLSSASSPSVLPMSTVASRNAFFARSVLVRRSLTLYSVGDVPLVSGPADSSRSAWSAAARLVASLVIFVSSCMCSSCCMSLSDWLIRSPPSEVAATTGSVSSATRRVLMRQLRRAIRDPTSPGTELDKAGGTGEAPPPPACAVPVDPPLPPLSPEGAGPGFWVCWGEEPRRFRRGLLLRRSTAIPLETSLH